MSDLSDLIGKNITKYRKSLNLNQEELASLVGTTRVTISRYESGTGEKGISSEMVTRIAKALKIKELDLVHTSETPSPLRIIETNADIIARVENGLKVSDILTFEIVDKIIHADKTTKGFLIEGLKVWIDLPHDKKSQLFGATVDESKLPRAVPNPVATPEQIEAGLKLMEIITPEIADEILNAPKKTKKILPQGIKDWLRLPYENQVSVVELAAELLEDDYPSDKTSQKKA